MSVVLVTGASTGIGRLTAEALARAGHHVFAGMRDLTGRNAAVAAEIAEVRRRDGLRLDVAELDVFPPGKKPFRSVVDFTRSNVEAVTNAAHAEADDFLTRMGFAALLSLART
ncbi:SDR family NAD(P)-dependent oxidoreductase [Actinoplanes sp. NPDC049265]|uniref:SDR family NAD(P)-dependent oxidoreductase n=1 Tax=Actinoplanes sp. NPDC049265 TaxID=3363902 RepID=UPI00370FAE19